MIADYPDKIAIGGAWAEFDDCKACWSLNRNMSARCGANFNDTFDCFGVTTISSARFRSS